MLFIYYNNMYGGIIWNVKRTIYFTHKILLKYVPEINFLGLNIFFFWNGGHIQCCHASVYKNVILMLVCRSKLEKIMYAKPTQLLLQPRLLWGTLVSALLNAADPMLITA